MANAPLFQWVEDDNPAEYSLSRVYNRSCDDKGHYKQVRVNMPGYVLAKVEGIIATKANCPWRSPADALRDALHHRLHWWAESNHDYDLAACLRQERAAEALERMQEENKRCRALVAAAAAALDECREGRDWEELAATFAVAEESIGAMRTWWATRMSAAIEPFRPFLFEAE